jgi:hypothetical protein
MSGVLGRHGNRDITLEPVTVAPWVAFFVKVTEEEREARATRVQVQENPCRRHGANHLVPAPPVAAQIVTPALGTFGRVCTWASVPRLQAQLLAPWWPLWFCHSPKAKERPWLQDASLRLVSVTVARDRVRGGRPVPL